VELTGRYSNPDNVSRLQRILAGHDRDRLPARTTRSVQRQRRLNRNEVRELLTQYNAGLLINQLAAQVDISRTTVMKHVERAGAPRRRNLLADRLDQARQLYDQGCSLARIGKHLGLNASTIRHAFHKAGLQMRDTHAR
jgi:transposase-like protein